MLKNRRISSEDQTNIRVMRSASGLSLPKSPLAKVRKPKAKGRFLKTRKINHAFPKETFTSTLEMAIWAYLRIWGWFYQGVFGFLLKVGPFEESSQILIQTQKIFHQISSSNVQIRDLGTAFPTISSIRIWPYNRACYVYIYIYIYIYVNIPCRP